MERIITQRLLLRDWTFNDVNDMFEYAIDPDVANNAGWEPHQNIAVTYKVIESFINSKEVWAIQDKRSGKVIGSIGFHRDAKRSHPYCRSLGYVLSKKFWGKGLMTEAASAVIEYAFAHSEMLIISVVHYPHNERSKRVIEKLKFKYDGTLRVASVPISNVIYDEVCYSLTKDEYLGKGK